MSYASQPLPDETPSLVPPPRLPPVLRGLLPPSGGGGGGGTGRYRPPHLFLLVVFLWGTGVSALIFAAWLVAQRPTTLAVAIIAVAIQVYRRRHLLRSPHFDLFPAKIYIGAIAGGIIGELLSQIVLHIDPGAPTGLLWLLAGAVGIGGGAGVLLAAFCTAAVGGLVGGWMLWGLR